MMLRPVLYPASFWLAARDPEGKRKNDVPDAFGFLGDAGPQVFVGDKVQKPLFELSPDSEHRVFAAFAEEDQAANIAVAHPVNLTGCRSDKTISRGLQSAQALNARIEIDSLSRPETRQDA